LEHLEEDLVGLAATAEPLRVGHTEQSEAAELTEGVAGEGRFGLCLAHPRQQLAAREVARHLDDRGPLVGGQHPFGGHDGSVPTAKTRSVSAHPLAREIYEESTAIALTLTPQIWDG